MYKKKIKRVKNVVEIYWYLRVGWYDNVIVWNK